MIKVCVVTHDLAPIIEPGVLYDVQMIPMRNKDAGYIVVAAEPHAFEAKISTTVVKHAVYMVEIRFGNKVIIFDPKDGKKESIRTIDGVLKYLEHREDIKDIVQVLDNVRRAANAVLTAFKNDGYYVNK